MRTDRERERERWTDKIKLMLAYQDFAISLKKIYILQKDRENIPFYRQHCCQVKTHIYTDHWQKHLLYVLIATNSIFT